MARKPHSHIRSMPDDGAAAREFVDKSVEELLIVEKARQEFIASKMGDVPLVYAARMGTDPQKFAGEEQEIRSELQRDLEAAGVRAADISIGNRAGIQKEPVLDLSRFSLTERLQMGMDELREQGRIDDNNRAAWGQQIQAEQAAKYNSAAADRGTSAQT